MTDHYHYDYASTHHDHSYAEQYHDHSLDYAEKHHRHYDDESVDRGLREDLGEAEGRIRDLESALRKAIERIAGLETRLHDHEQTVPHEESQA